MGWRAAASLRSDLARDAREQALYDRELDGPLVHQGDRGVQTWPSRWCGSSPILSTPHSGGLMLRLTSVWPSIILATMAACSPLRAQSPAASPPPASPTTSTYPTKDRWGKPLPSLTFYCQYLGLAKDASGKYPLYQNAMFTMATSQGAIQNAWKAFVESTYHPASEGNPMCAIIPADPAEREGVLKTFNLLTQPATQIVVKTDWKP